MTMAASSRCGRSGRDGPSRPTSVAAVCRQDPRHVHHRPADVARPERPVAAHAARPAANSTGPVRRRRGALERYRKLRDEWLVARRDLVDRTHSAREMAQEADRLKFALDEISQVDPAPGEDEALVADIRRLSELDAVRAAAAGARGSVRT